MACAFPLRLRTGHIPWLATLLVAMAPLLPSDARAAGLEIPDPAGGTSPLVGAGQAAGVLIFVSHDCPVCTSYAAEIQRLAERYAAQRVAVRVVLEDPDLDAAQAQAWATAYGIACPLVLDPQHRLAGSAQARITPEAAVVSPSGEVLYHGRIDDAWAALGKRRAQATTHDLRDALDAVLAGGTPRPATGGAVGCVIPAPTSPGAAP
jgi:peroxiredoxin